MVEFNPVRCHSRENGNPEPKNQYPWIPASAGMTYSNTTNLNFRNLKSLTKSKENSDFSRIMSLIWTAMYLYATSLLSKLSKLCCESG
jgi:hypothetical protein